jgi:surfactin synthase thioesterase subunit
MRKHDSDRRVQLVCLPCAGASAEMYRSWRTELSDLVHVRPVSLPGRAELRHLPLCYDLHLVAESLADDLAEYDNEIALFGYSVGALVGFEAARRLVARRRPPVLLIVAACDPPSVPPRRRDLHVLSDPELIDWVRAQGATPEAILSNTEMMALLLPVLRADIALFDGYHYRQALPLPVPIVTVTGRQDPLTDPVTMTGWGEESELPPRDILLEGGHMFINDQERAVIDVVRDALEAFTAVRGRPAQ